MTDPIHDRERLRQRSADGLRRSVRIALIVSAVVFVAILAFAFALLDDVRSGPGLVIVLAGLAAAAGIVVTAIIVARRMSERPPLLLGADRATQDAVKAALRAGGTTDPRIHELARETARRGSSQWWVVVFAAAVALLQVLLLVVRIADHEWPQAALSAMLMGLMGTAAISKTLELRRYRAYLREPGPAEAPRTAA